MGVDTRSTVADRGVVQVCTVHTHARLFVVVGTVCRRYVQYLQCATLVFIRPILFPG